MLNAAIGTTDMNHHWWRVLAADGGYRLSALGVQWMLKLIPKEEVHSFPLKGKKTPAKFLMALDKSMETPYYIIEAKGQLPSVLLLFSPKEATVAMLCDDPELFAAGLSPRKR